MSGLDQLIQLINWWFEKPVTYAEFQDDITETCKLEFGDFLRRELRWTTYMGLVYWLLGWMWGYTSSAVFYSPSSYELGIFLQMDAAYDCLQRSGVPQFSQENFDSEYWFQKGYVIQFASSLQKNPTPAFFSKQMKEMGIFWTAMLEFYDLPLVAPLPE